MRLQVSLKESTFFYPIGPRKLWYLIFPQVILAIYVLGCISWAVSVIRDEAQSAHEKELLFQKYLADLVVIALA